MFKKMRKLMFYITVPLLLFSAIGCKDDKQDLLDQLTLFETGRYEGEALAEERLAELQAAVKKYEAEVNARVEASSQLGEHYKMLAIEFMNREMYGEALKYLILTIDYYPENEVVFYFCGLCSARMAKAKVNRPSEQEILYQEAEKYYLRAIALDGQFVQALYGLSVLYVFEFDRVTDAEPLLIKILEKEKKHSSAMFLLAQVYVYSGMIEEAIDLYDRIIDVGQSDEEKARAADLKQRVLAGAYE